MHTNTGDRAFGISGLHLWNSLLLELKQLDLSLQQFGEKAKAISFVKWDNWQQCTVNDV